MSLEKVNATYFAECPVCGADVPVPTDVILYELLVCPECGSELEVWAVPPDKIVLKLAPETEEDWGE